MIDAEAVKKNSIIEIVGHFTPLVKHGSEYRGQCVACDDTHSMMYVSEKKGNVVCYACGIEQNIIEFLMAMEGLDEAAATERLTNGCHWQPALSVPAAPPVPPRITSAPPADAPTPKMGTKNLGEPVHIYPVRGLDGGVLGYECEYIDLEIRVWTWGARGDGAPAWGMGNFSKLRPLYGLDRIGQRPGARILVVEHPEDADVAARTMLKNYNAVAFTGGMGEWNKTDLEPLRGKHILLLPRANEHSDKSFRILGNILADPALLQCSVRMIDASRMKDNWCIAQAEHNGWTPEEFVKWAQEPGRTFDIVVKAMYGPPNLPVSERGEEPPPMGMAEKPVKPKHKKQPLTVVGGNSNLAEELDTEEVPLPYTEDGVAKQFVELHKDIFRVTHENKTALWFTWDGSRWKRDPARVIAMQKAVTLCTGLIYQAKRERVELSAKTKDRIGSRPFKGNFLDLAGIDRRLVAEAALFDSHPLKLNTPGGTVDLATGEMYPQRQEDYLTRQTMVTPKEGPHPYFDNALDRLCGGDARMRDYILRSFGMSLTGDQREENFYFLLGAPQCGKTKLIEAIYKILGNTDTGGYGHKCNMELFVESKHDKGNEALAHFNGARFVFTSETEEGRHWKAALLKLVCGGDTLDGRLLYQNKQSFTPTHHLWIFGNSQPHLKSSRDDGIRRRMHLLKYPGVIPDSERDKQFPEHLQAEYPAILFTLIRAAMEWLEIGLKPPASVVENVNNYMQAEDTIGQWFEASCDVGEQARAIISAAYSSYKYWSEQNGEYLMSKKRFSQMLESRGFERGRGVDRYFIGFALKDAPRQMDAMPLPEPPQDWQDRF
jgi:P4 family phage/plasmid primase-like protien